MTDHEPSPREAADYLHAHPGEFLTIPSALRPHVHALMDLARAATHPAETGDVYVGLRPGVKVGRTQTVDRDDVVRLDFGLVDGLGCGGGLREVVVGVEVLGATGIEIDGRPARSGAATHPAEGATGDEEPERYPYEPDGVTDAAGWIDEVAEALSEIALDPADQGPGINALANQLKALARRSPAAAPGEGRERELAEIARQLDSHANIADRPGQTEDLERLANRLRALAHGAQGGDQEGRR